MICVRCETSVTLPICPCDCQGWDYDKCTNCGHNVWPRYGDEPSDEQKEHEECLAWYNRGHALFELGRYSEVIECLEKSGDDSPTWIAKAYTLEKLFKYEEAIQYYDKALEDERETFIDPRPQTLLIDKGSALHNLGKFEEAIQCYDKLLETPWSSTSITLYNKGNALSKLGRLEEAIACYDKALEKDPDNPDNTYAWTQLRHSSDPSGRDLAYDGGLVWFDDGNSEAEIALRYCAKAWTNKGNLLSLLHKDKEAQECYDRATKCYDSAFQVPSGWTWQDHLKHLLCIKNHPCGQ